MRKVEYKKITSNVTEPELSWEEVKRLGEEGWELVTVVDAHGSPTFYLKKFT